MIKSETEKESVSRSWGYWDDTE